MRFFWNRLVGKGDSGEDERIAPVIPFNNGKIVEEYRSVLKEMRDILRRNTYLDESQFVEDTLTALERNSADFVELITGRGMWGGSSSVSDCLFEANTRENLKQARLDDSRMVTLLAQLVRRLAADGMKDPRIESLGIVYEKAIQKGLASE